ncbi:hypothetical protein D3C87_1378050 [compost metagenome]
MHVRAQPDRKAGRDDLDHAPQGVAGRTRLVDQGHHLRGGPGIRTADRGSLCRLPKQREVVGKVLGLHRPNRPDMREDLDAEFGEEDSRQGTNGHASGGLASARTLEHVSDILVAVLAGAGVIGMAGADLGDALGGDRLEPRRILGIQGLGRHGQLPVGEVLVRDLEGDRSSRSQAVAHSGAKRHTIGLDLHALASPVALLAPGQLGVDRMDVQRDACGEAFDDRELHRPMGLACR